MERAPALGTYCSDPEATHTVTTGDPRFGYGIFGYYKSQWDAFVVRRFLKLQDCQNVSVEDYDPGERVVDGIHPMIEAHFKGFV